MPNLSRFPVSRLFPAATTLLLAVAPLTAEPATDQVLIDHLDGRVVRSFLPAGPAATLYTSVPAGQLVFAPDGRILAASGQTLAPIPASQPTLEELMPDGSLRRIGVLSAYSHLYDMAFDHRGRLFVLLSTQMPASTTRFETIREIDPVAGTEISSRPTAVASITTAPDGLWALADNKLRKLDPDSLALGPIVADLGIGASSLASSSDGKIYFRPGCSWPCPQISFVDPATGEISSAPESLYGSEPINSFAIDHRCRESATTRCLQDGRFRAQVDYSAYDGASGSATVTPARSADTAVFSFFDPANWELMVKVLDGCEINQHFWVYSSASTDVEYTMTITDTQTGEEKVYTNPLGQIALTVTDNLAFSCP